MNALKLIEGNKTIRDRYVNNFEVLTKVKEITLLPDAEHLTLKMVAEFYEVDKEVIQRVIQRHKEEIYSDGVKVLKGEDLAKYKLFLKKNHWEIAARSVLTVITRRAVLRIGMLLTDSEVAKEIRAYLLNIEEETKIFKRWSREEENMLLNHVVKEVRNNKTLTETLETIASTLNRNVQSCMNKWSRDVKFRAPEDVLAIISNNRFKTKESNDVHESESKAIAESPIDKKIDSLLIILQEQLTSYKDEVKKYQQEQLKLSNKAFQLESELHSTKIILEEKDKSIDLLNTTIKNMDDYTMRTVKERDNAEAKAKRYQKKYKELEASVKTLLSVTQGQQDTLVQTEQKMLNSGADKPLLRFKQDRNGNLTEIK